METGDVLLFAEPLMLRPMALSVCLGLLLASGYALLRPWPPKRRRVTLFAGVALLVVLAVGGLLRQRTVELDLQAQTVTVHQAFLGIGRAHQRSLADATGIVVKPAQRRRAGPRETVRLPAHQFLLSLEFVEETIGLATIEEVLKAENAARGLSVRLGLPAQRSGYRLRAGTSVEAARPFELEDGRVGAQFDLEPVVQILDSPARRSSIREVPSDQPRETEKRS